MASLYKEPSYSNKGATKISPPKLACGFSAKIRWMTNHYLEMSL